MGLLCREIKKTLLTVSLFIYCVGFSQTVKYPVIGVPVERNSLLLNNPWVGGINAPEIWPIDLDGDGRNDLFIFDRTGDKVYTFLNDGSQSDTAFHYAPQYEKIFPKMTLWATLCDYNNDGIADIFTYQPGVYDTLGHTVVPTGIKVYKGGRINGNLHFNAVQDCLYYKDPPYTVALLPNSLGVPAFVDVNHDGDIDILTFNIYGTAVEYYENQTRELGLPADSITYVLTNSCWGNFYAGATALEISLNVSCKSAAEQAANNGAPRHSGAALWGLDYNEDHDEDLLISGIHGPNMVFVDNTGDSSYANMGWADTLWPGCNTPVNLAYFPAAFGFDADNDGDKDILITPNFSTSAIDINNISLYRNMQQQSCPFQYTHNDSFLVHTMMDFGTDSKGVFFDYNNDGLMDIVVGNYYYYNPIIAGSSKLALYENTGTPTQPKFKEVTLDFANLSIYHTGSGTLNLNPAFGDLDGDGKPDMIVGDADGNVHYFKGTGAGLSQFPGMTTPNLGGIDVGSSAAPFIYDVNGDSLPDLVIGRQDGKLSYYPNIGTRTAPLFNADTVNDFFGRVNVTEVTVNEGFSQPFIMRDTAGEMLLFVGSNRGTVFEYLLDTTKLRGGNFTLIDSDFLGYDAGAKATMQAYDLNGDGKLEYLVGNSCGGLQMFSETVWDSSVILSAPRIANEPLTVNVYPNPAKESFTCVVNNATAAKLQVEVYNLLGEKMPVNYILAGNRVTCSTMNLPNGMYIVRITVNNQSGCTKVFIQN